MLNPLSQERKSVVHQNGKQFIQIAFLPIEVQEHVKAFDRNGDGLIATDELVEMSNAHRTLSQSNYLFKRMLMAMVVIMVFVVLAVFGLSFAVYELSKESTVGADAVMRHVGDQVVVQTANSDFTVNGSLLTQRETGEVVKTTPASTNFDAKLVDPASPNAFWEDLSTVRFSSGKSYASFTIQAFTRTPSQTEGTSDHITFLTTAGDITLVGMNDWRFSDSVGEVLTNAGFELKTGEGEGRKLQFAFFALAAVTASLVGGTAYTTIDCAVSEGASTGSCSFSSAVFQGLMG